MAASINKTCWSASFHSFIFPSLTCLFFISNFSRVSEEKEESVRRLKDEQESFDRKIQQLEQHNLLIAHERESMLLKSHPDGSKQILESHQSSKKRGANPLALAVLIRVSFQKGISRGHYCPIQDWKVWLGSCTLINGIGKIYSRQLISPWLLV